MGGVLLLGYEMYRLLTTKRVLAKPRRGAAKKVTTPSAPEPVVIDLEEEECNKTLLKGSACHMPCSFAFLSMKIK